MLVARRTPARLVIIGHPIHHSMSPLMHNAALAHCGLAHHIPRGYERLDVPIDTLSAALAELAHDRAAGNVTIPHKEAVARAARCTPLASRVGAVNTFWHDDGILIGHNTDVAGVIDTLHMLGWSALSQARCAVIGAGGAAASVLVALDMLGARDVRLTARTAARGLALQARVEVAAAVVDRAEEAVRDAQLVINTTPIGLRDDDYPVPMSALASGATIFDCVYRPDETAWVRAARAAGHAALDGLPMLVAQGAAAFACWFGVTPPISVMWQALGVRRDVPTRG
jgi:shikimate dehydrogenase